VPFPETADIETSSDAYAARFGGAVGAWMLAVQERLALDLLRDLPQASVLDVGGGHGQLALPLCRLGHPVTVLSSDESCRRRIASAVQSGACRFRVGNVIALPYSNRAFDVAVCFRLLTHCAQWPKLVDELCRVARRAVIVDYPTSQSVNAVAPALFGAKKRLEGDTRTWRLFRHDEVLAEFRRNRFEPAGIRKQFFLPMVLHRAHKSSTLARVLEGGPRLLGLTSRWGSPVILKCVPSGRGTAGSGEAA
jgi:2-polyprenyl-3-methyl-5-hydroxy-6-metoxy-1,4-benzoquinol methylase